MKRVREQAKPFRILIALSAIYLVIRIYNLTLLPIFTDEAIYIFWAKTIEQSMSQFFISVADGKPPLFIWTTSVFLRLFPDDMFLLAGRLVSVFSGLATLLAIVKTTRLLTDSKKAPVFASLLYIILPFAVMYDRLALLESMVTATLIWAVYFALKTAQSQKTSHALLWGFFLALALLTKTTAIAFVFTTPLVFLLATNKKQRKDLKKILKLVVIPIATSQLTFNLLRVSSVFHLMNAKNQQFTRNVQEVIATPITTYAKNLATITNDLTIYYTLPLLTLVAASFLYLLFTKQKKIALSLLILFALPILSLSILGTTLYPRYIFFTTPYALIAASLAITPVTRWQKFRVVMTITVLLTASITIDRSARILSSPQKAILPQVDTDQFITKSPSGYGLDEVTYFLNKKNSATLVTQGTFGLLPYALQLEYWNNPNYSIIPTYPLTLPQDPKIASESVYFLIQDEESITEDLNYKVIKKISRPRNYSQLILAQPQ